MVPYPATLQGGTAEGWRRRSVRPGPTSPVPRRAALLPAQASLDRRPVLAKEWPAGPCLRVRHQRRDGPLSRTKMKVRWAGGAHALPRRSGPARLRLSPSSRASPGRREGAAGPNLQSRASARGGLREDCAAGGAGPGTMGAAGGRGDNAGPAAERPLVWRVPGAECGGGGLAQTRRAPGAC